MSRITHPERLQRLRQRRRVMAKILDHPESRGVHQQFLPALHPAEAGERPDQSIIKNMGQLIGRHLKSGVFMVNVFAVDDIRSMTGCIVLLGFVLYPYVYALGRGAFLEQSRDTLEAALTVLERADRGFVLLVESGLIDKYTHAGVHPRQFLDD